MNLETLFLRRGSESKTAGAKISGEHAIDHLRGRARPASKPLSPSRESGWGEGGRLVAFARAGALLVL